LSYRRINRQRTSMRYRLSTAGLIRQWCNFLLAYRPYQIKYFGVSCLGPARAFFFMMFTLTMLPQDRRGPVCATENYGGEWIAKGGPHHAGWTPRGGSAGGARAGQGTHAALLHRRRCSL